MSTAAKSPAGPATLGDLLARPEVERWEIIDGHLVPKEAASGKHGEAQAAMISALVPYRGRGGEAGRPGGWRFATEVLVEFDPAHVRRPDIAGWRRERLPVMPADVPLRVRPDWICEILSPSNASDDTVKKMRLYHRASVGHYWLLDPLDETLAVYRWTAEGYLYVLGATSEDTVRAEPFPEIELRISRLFGDDEDSGPQAC